MLFSGPRTGFITSGAIPKALRVTYTTTCGRSHRGICRIKDAINFNYIWDIGSRTENYILEHMADGDWFSLSATLNVAGDTFEKQAFAYVGHQRYRDPKLCILALASSTPQLDHSFLLELMDDGVLSASTVFEMVKGLVGNHTSGINLDLNVYDVVNMKITDLKAIGRVHTVGVRLSQRVHDAALHVMAPP